MSLCHGRRFLGLTEPLGDSRAGDAQWKWHRSHRQTMLAPFDVVLNINVDLTLISAIAAASWVLNQWRENISLVGPVQMADSRSESDLPGWVDEIGIRLKTTYYPRS